LGRPSRGYRQVMTTAIVLIVVAIVVVAVVAMLVQRRAKAQVSVLRVEAADHRADAEAANKAASLQESHATELAATAERNQADAEKELQAATLKREVAADLHTRADTIDPDVPDTDPDRPTTAS